MKIMVTGGAGFIGSHTVDALIARGDEVLIVDNLVTGQREFINPAADFREMDIRDAALRELAKEEGVEGVIHLAAQIDVRKSVADPIFDAQSNILGSLNVIEAALAAGARRFVFASTGGAIYGDTDERPTPETALCQPCSPYGITKFSIEKYLYYYQVQHGLSYAVNRYANVYGPRQNPHGEAGVVAIFAQRMLRGEPLAINGDGTQTRDYVFVGDVVRANLAALDADYIGVCNIGTAVESDVNRIFHLINDALEAGREETHGPVKPGEQKTSCVDWRLASKLMGWKPQVSLDEGIRQTAHWFRDQHQ